MKRFFCGKRVLITGANGFIGRHLVRALDARGARLHLLDQVLIGIENKHVAYKGDMTDGCFLKSCLASCNPHYVFHLAAFKPRSAALPDFHRAVSVNVTGTHNLLSALAGRPSLSAVLLMGTCEEYGTNPSPYRESMRERPLNAYSYSKLCMTKLAETLHALYRLPVVVVRPTLAYGPGQLDDMFLPSLIRALMKRTPFRMTKGEQTRDYVFIDDLIEALLCIALSPHTAGRIINISSNKPVTMRNLAKKVEKLIGYTRRLVRFGSIPYRANEAMEYHASHALATKLTGWKPRVSLDAGLIRTITWYQEHDSQ